MFACGDEDAFRSIYDSYAAGLRYFATRYITDLYQVDDLVQEAFVLLWNKRRDFASEAAMRAYLYRSVQSACLNILRHRKVVDNYAASYRPDDEISTFLDNVFEAEVFQQVAEVFQELSPATKKVYELSLEGMRHDEISQMLDISVNTIKKHKNTANHYMKRRLKNVF